MEENRQLTEDGNMDVGKQIYDRMLTIPLAAEKYGVTYGVARGWLRLYRRTNGLPANNNGFAKPCAAAAKKADCADLEQMTRDQLIDEVIRARVEAERAKKGHTARGGGAEKEFFSLDGASLK
jgi:hypothetical protein